MTPLGKRLQRHHLLLSCVVCTGAVLLLSLLPPYRSLEGAARDKLAEWGKKAPPPAEVVMVAIDNESRTLENVYEEDFAASPALRLMRTTQKIYPRSVYPLIIERLLGAGAKLVAFDIVFDTEDAQDPIFRESLEKHADKVLLGYNIEERAQEGWGEETRIRPTPAPLAASLLSAQEGLGPRTGFVNFWPDEDSASVVRRALYNTTPSAAANLPEGPGDLQLYSFAARILQRSGHADKVPAGHAQILIRFNDVVRPLPLFQLFIDSYWNNPPYFKGEVFRDKIVIVGPYGNLAKDYMSTPLGTTEGPRVHLSAINAALNNDFLTELSPLGNLLLIVAAGFAAWLVGRLFKSPLNRFLLLIVLAAAYYGTIQLLFNHHGLYLLLLSPLLAFVSSGTTFSVIGQVIERLEKAELRRKFERYVSRDAVKELLDNPDTFLNASIGVRKTISLLFSDVRGFTTLTESADATELVTQLNEYFTEMVRIVFEHNGTLDKFIGDAVMAHWGSFETAGPATDARRAVSTALHMSRALVELNQRWKARGAVEIKIGVGVNTGEAIVGNLGAEQRQEITAIGDPVNVASRLEGATKQFHVELLIGESVEALVRDAFVVRTAGWLQLKGKTRSLGVFTVLKERAENEPLPEWLVKYENGMRLYLKRDFAGAAAALTESLALNPDDWLTTEYLQGARNFELHPPEPGWDGVLVMTSK